MVLTRAVMAFGLSAAGSIASLVAVVSMAPSVPEWLVLVVDWLIGGALGTAIRQRRYLAPIVLAIFATYPIAQEFGLIAFLGESWWIAAGIRAIVVSLGYVLGYAYVGRRDRGRDSVG
ncbi:MAG: hypothetical protein HYX57_00730 [Chloroflexi bacterium]|nr:hypothetical protein [Chloroflexota bacterium]